MEFEMTILHVILHVTTILVAFGLFIVSAISYSRDRRTKFLYITGAFLVFCIKEILQALLVFVYTSTDPIIIHPLNLVILILFFAGVTK
jgi:threonine/homoserine/homoserine lactone efflux protein